MHDLCKAALIFKSLKEKVIGIIPLNNYFMPILTMLIFIRRGDTLEFICVSTCNS